MAYWYCTIGGWSVSSLVLEQEGDVSNSTLGFFLVGLARLVLAGNLIQKVLKVRFGLPFASLSLH